MIKLAAILGFVEGLTEFIPVSSTGHLILAGHWLGFHGEKAATFEIFIQLGAILAVVCLYRQSFCDLLNPHKKEGFAGVRGSSLLITTTLPALGIGFLVHSAIKEYLFNPVSVAIGLALGGVWLIVTEKRLVKPKKTGLNSLNLKDALLIGFFQCLALWPGISRSAATILGAMTIGYDRKTATEYSFFAAVPVLFAATVLDLIKSRDLLTVSDLPFFMAGFFVSFVTAFLAVKYFIRFVSKHSLQGFGWYRLVLAGLVLLQT